MADLAPAQAVSLGDQLARTRQTVVDQIWRWAGWFAALDLPIIAWRVAEVGWHPQLEIQAALCALALAVALGSARLPHALKSGLLVLCTLGLGVSGVLTLGMVGAGFFWMALSAALASVLHSLRAGMGVALFSSAVLTATGLGFVSGWLMVPFDLNAHAASRSAWASYLAVTIAVPFVMLYAIGGFQKTVLELLARLHAQRDQLLVQRELLDRQRDQLEIQASHDTLTGLPVTRLAMARLQAALDNAIRSGERTALLFIDLDGFKAVNDTQGHDVGDLVLQEVARRLRAVVRAEDTVARIGGDEFLAILAQPGSGEASTAAVADALIKAVSRPMQAAGVTVSVGASIGVAICPDHAADLPGLRRLADAAMYQAKRSGKNRHCFATAPAPARA